MQNPLRSLPGFILLCMLALLGASCSPEAKKMSHLRSADRYFADGELDKAEIEYLNVLKLDARNARAVGRLGLIYSEEGRFNRAAAYLVAGHELQPEDLELRLKIGQFALGLPNFKDARDQANYILDRQPQHPEAPLLLVATIAKPDEIQAIRQRLQGLPPPAPAGAPVLVALGLLEFRQGRLKEAEAAFRQAMSVDSKFAAAYSALGALHFEQKDVAAAEQAFKKAAELSPPRSPRRMQYAQFEVRTGNLAAGKRVFEEITKKAPDYAPAWIALAESALNEKKLDECATLVGKALARDPENIEGLLIRGRLKLAQNKNDQAVAEFEKLAGAYPRLPVVHFDLGRAYIAAGQTDKAIDSMNQAVNLAPSYGEAAILLAGLNINRGDFSAAIILLKRLVQQRPDLAQAPLYLAEAYRGQGNFDDALALYSHYDKLFPHNSQTPVLRGMALLQQRKFSEARQAFEHALELTPDDPSTLEHLVNLDLMERKYHPARERVEAQLAKNPKLAGPVQLLLAKIFLAQNDKTQAETALKRAIELTPDSSAAYFLLAGIYVSTKQQEKALANLEQTFAHNPKDTKPLLLIGVIQDRQKNYPAARDAYEKLLAVNPRSPVVLNNLAYLYAEQFGQLDKAQEYAQKARDLQPGDPRTTDTLGWILFKKRQFPQALSLLQQAADKLPAEPEVQFHLGMTHYMMGDEEPARLALRTALQPGSEFAGNNEARKSLAILETDLAGANPASRGILEKAAAERKDDPVALTRLAVLYEHEGNLDKAINTLESALKINARNPNVLIGLARLHAAKKDAAKALDFAKAARKIVPDDATVAHTLGRLAYQMGDYSWAASLLQEAARKQPDSPELLFDLAESSYSVGLVADAEAALRSALQQAGLFLRAEEARRFLDLIALAANPAEALTRSAQIEQRLKSDPAYVPALMVSGAISEQRRDAAAARQTYEKVLNRFPDFAPAKLRLAILGAAQAEFDQKAYDLATQARTAYPNNPELAKALGILTYRKGDHARASALLKESSVALGNDAELWYYLGMAQVQTKDLPGSRQSLQKSLDLGLRADLAAEARKTLEGGK